MRISTRFTVLSAAITTIAAIVAIGSILVSEFEQQKALLRAEVEAAVARGGEWAKAVHLREQDTLASELRMLLLTNPLIEGVVVRDLDDKVLADAGRVHASLPRLRPIDSDPLATQTVTVETTQSQGSGAVGGLQMPYVYAISVPVLASVNPLTEIEDDTSYRIKAAQNSEGARFATAYIEAQTSVVGLLGKMLPRASTLALVALTLVTIAFIFVRSTVRRISRPMEELAATADDISSGKIPRTINIAGHQNDEIGDIANVLNGVIQGVHKMTAQLNVDRELMSIKVDTAKKQLSAAEAQVNQTRNRLKRVEYFDPVTSLPNRRLMLEQLEMLIRIAEREKRQLGVLVIDVENLRRINESLGREAGDALLRVIAKRLIECLRDSDVVGIDQQEADTTDVSRIGNNEFCALLHGIRETSDALLTARRVNEQVSAPVEINGSVVAPILRIGVAVAPEHAGSGEDILRVGDIAVTEARNQGSGDPLLFNRELDDAGSERFQLEADLRRANFDREFSLHYQPQINCETGLLCGAEALIRWHHPKRGNIPPFKFIPIAEESGLIIELGQWIVERACADLATFRSQGLGIPKLSVNISALQLTDELIDTVRAALASNGLSARQLQLELTESLLVQDVDAVLGKLNRLHQDVGVRLSVDDFGTGYSSLAYLARFPLDELKVDRSFVVGMEADESAAKVTGAIIAMAQQLDLDVVVEGVDNPLQLLRLQGYGAQVIQGFLFARPMPAKELVDYIEEEDWRDIIASIAPPA